MFFVKQFYKYAKKPTPAPFNLLDESPLNYFDDLTSMLDDLLSGNNAFAQYFIQAYGALEDIGFILLAVSALIHIIRIIIVKNVAPWKNDYLNLLIDKIVKALILGGMPWIISKVLHICIMIKEAI
jgi:hypothetical protein